MQSIKCVAVGDGGVGKTCMLISYINGETPTGEYIPTVFDNFTCTVPIDGRIIRLELWDTAGQENYDRLRPLAYPNSDVILLCFSIAYPTSFRNIEEKWLPEIKHFCPESKIILVGTKYDSRNNERITELLKLTNEEPVRHSQGLLLAEKICAAKYQECSAFTRAGLQDVFDAAIEAVLHPPERKQKKGISCSIL